MRHRPRSHDRRALRRTAKTRSITEHRTSPAETGDQKRREAERVELPHRIQRHAVLAERRRVAGSQHDHRVRELVQHQPDHGPGKRVEDDEQIVERAGHPPEFFSTLLTSRWRRASACGSCSPIPAFVRVSPVGA